MTDTARMTTIDSLMRVVLENEPTSPTAIQASQDLTDLNVTVQEWLVLAYREQRLANDFDISALLKSPEDNEEEDDDDEDDDDDEEEHEHEHEEEHENHCCATCGSQCVPVCAESDTEWLCESCYYGTLDQYQYQYQSDFYDGATEI